MSYSKKTKKYLKFIERVIMSCKTIDQVDSAKNLFYNTYRYYGNIPSLRESLSAGYRVNRLVMQQEEYLRKLEWVKRGVDNAS